MRFRVAKFSILIVLIEIIALYYSWKFITKFGSNNVSVNITLNKPVIVRTGSRHVSKLVTVVIRNVELQENDVTLTVESIISIFPNIQIYIICNGYPYPPLEFSQTNSTYKNVKLFNLAVNLNVPFKDSYPLFQIKTKYALFIPDSVRFTTKQSIVTMLNEIVKAPDKIIATPISNDKNIQCVEVDLNVREWTLKYKIVRNDTCDSIVGRQAILVEVQVLKRLPNVFMLPFPEAFYIQTTAIGVKVSFLSKINF